MRLAIPKELFNGHLVFRWDILGPLDRPVTISAVDAVIGVYGITEGVRIFTERGHVSVVDVSGSTQIRGSDNTTAIWAGSKGPVTIDTRGSISLKVTDRSFRTTLRASCNEALGLWLPSDSHPGIQIDVERDDALTHMDLSPVSRQQRDGRMMIVYGNALPQIYLTSLRGNVFVRTYAQRAR